MNARKLAPLLIFALLAAACQFSSLPVQLVTLTPNLTETATFEGGGPNAGQPGNTQTAQTGATSTQGPGATQTTQTGATPTNATGATPAATTPAAPGVTPAATFTSSSPQRTSAPSATATHALAAPPRVGLAGARTLGDPYAPELGNGGYDVYRYAIHMALDPAQTAVLSADVIIQAKATLDNLGEISLDFVGFDIHTVSVNGLPANYGRDGDKLVVDFAQPVKNGSDLLVEVQYSGKPTQERSRYAPFEDHLGLFFFTGLKRLYVESEPDGARYVFPCNDHPRDKAAFEFQVTVPEKMVAVANGVLIKTATEVPNAFPDGRAGDVYTWEQSEPMATYLATIAVGDYVRIEGKTPHGTPLRSYVFSSQVDQYKQLEPRLGQALDYMSDTFGPYPFKQFGYVMADQFPGALEAQSMILLGVLREDIMIHEMAHQWFGDSVSLHTWGDIWLNEGFATYIAALWDTSDDPAKMKDQLQGWQKQFHNTLPYPLNDPPVEEMFGPLSYEGGAWLLADLRAQIGDKAFYSGLRNYFKLYSGVDVTWQQFEIVMEQASGKHLETFFARWLK